jgi:hypothetical protein
MREQPHPTAATERLRSTEGSIHWWTSDQFVLHFSDRYYIHVRDSPFRNYDLPAMIEMRACRTPVQYCDNSLGARKIYTWSFTNIHFVLASSRQIRHTKLTELNAGLQMGANME